ncbi:hypothetical protein N8G13_00920 [Mycoplasma zalophi]|uniref:hypothetical protein n=1 Tax=Mycoplasma zalophi TaxID=191287 RepID=UPI0021CACC83|nr:hypothetical protein [Mycoplasma zalophi]MCU4117026.1 hypothetical protein [Mycoplasma zalophi]
MNKNICQNCGASFSPDKIRCKYCLTHNPNYAMSKQELKDLKSEEQIQNKFIDKLLQTNENQMGGVNININNGTQYNESLQQRAATLKSQLQKEINIGIWILWLFLFMPGALVYAFTRKTPGPKVAIKIISVIIFIVWLILVVLWFATTRSHASSYY